MRVRCSALKFCFVAAVLVAPTPLLIGSMGCSVVGAGIGRSIDESKFQTATIESDGDNLVGRRVRLQLTAGAEYTGRVDRLMRVEDAPALVIQRTAHQSLFHSVASSSDTVVVSPFDALSIGGEPGNGQSIGFLAGLAVDVFLLYTLKRELDKVVLN